MKTVTLEEIIKRVKDVHGERVVLDASTFVLTNKKARFIDKEYGEWWAMPSKVTLGQGHPSGKYEKISESRRASIEDIRNKIKEVHGETIEIIEILKKHGTSRMKGRFIDKDYGEWEADVAPVLGGVGHPKRKMLEYKNRKRDEMVAKAIETAKRDENVEIKENSIIIEKRAKNHKITLIDKDYGEWTTKIETFIDGGIHPNRSHAARKERMIEKYGAACYANSKDFIKRFGNKRTSKAEEEIREFIKSLDFETSVKSISGFEYDVCVESKKVCIEHNGLYFHSEIKGKSKNFHLQKKIACNRSGYRLLHIWEHWWMHRKEQVKGYVESVLGVNRRTYARLCDFKELTYQESSEFLEATHIQGASRRTNLSIGGFLNGELVCVASFGKHHRNNTAIVLNRFAARRGVTVVGGLSKISKMASSIFKQDIYTWADLCISEGNGYDRSGWIKEEILLPDYFYYKSGKGYIPKQALKKSNAGIPDDQTEKEFADENKYFRVWDCGKIRYRFPFISCSSS